jgi:hypothetical protein
MIRRHHWQAYCLECQRHGNTTLGEHRRWQVGLELRIVRPEGQSASEYCNSSGQDTCRTELYRDCMMVRSRGFCRGVAR